MPKISRYLRGVTAFFICLTTQFYTLEPSLACPGCQNPNLPVVPSGGVFLDRGDIQWGALFTSSPLWVRHDAGCDNLINCDERIVQPKYIHDQFILPMELRANLEWGWSEHLGLSVQLPIRLIYTTIDYELPNGMSYQPLDAGVHHRNEALVGLADANLSLRWAESFYSGWWIIARLGSSLPLGRTEENPFTAGDRGEKHQHVQMGTGTFDPFTSIAFAQSFALWQVSFYGQASLPLYESSKGFKAGLLTLLNAKLSYRLKKRALVHTSLSWFRQGAEEWDGKIQQDGIYGRQEVLLGIGSTMSFGGPQYILMAQVPIWRELFQGINTERGEIFSPFSLTIGLQGRL